MPNKNMMQAEETDNRLGWFTGTVVREFYSNDMDENKSTYDNADRTQRYWEVRPDDILQEWDGEVPELIQIKFGLGEGWFPTEDGSTVRHQDDTDEENPKRFNMRSGWGQMVGMIAGQKHAWSARRVAVMDGGPEEVEYDFTGFSKYLTENEYDDSRVAGFSVGCQFEFRGLGLDYGTRPGEQEREIRSKALPVRFIGFGGAVDSPAPRSTGKASAPEVTIDAVTEMVGEDIDPGVIASLTSLLNVSGTKSSFRKNALELVGDNEVAKGYVMDDDGLWSLKS